MEIGSKSFDIMNMGGLKPQTGINESLRSDSVSKPDAKPVPSGKDSFQAAFANKLEKNPVVDAKSDGKKTESQVSKYEAQAPHKPEEKAQPKSNKITEPAEKSNPNVYETREAKPIAKRQDIEQKTSVEVVIDDEDSTEFTIDDKVVMVEFLANMQQELKIEPKNIVEAMMNLSDEDLKKPLEETMSQVLAQLNLTPEQKAKAEVMYQEMLTDMSKNSLARWAESTGRKVDVKVMGPDELKELKSLQSIDQLSKKFFGEPKRSETAPLAPLAAAPIEGGPGERAAKTNAAESFFPQYDSMSPGKGTVKRPDMTGSQTTNPVVSNSAAPSSKSKDVDPKTIDLAALGLSYEMGKNGFEVPTETSATGKTESATTSLSSTSADATQTLDKNLMSALGLDAKSDDSQGESKESGSDSSQSPSQFASFMAEKPAQGEFVKSVAGAGVAPTTLTADEQANVRNVLQGAQLLVQKGGGEMRVKLTPEGMGTVDVKVNVKDGKVDIQMFADTAEAKKLLESGLDDLKGSLLQHKLSLDNVKVDAANTKLGTALDQQFLNQERENAREFLGQFREFNNARRNGFHEIGDLKGYGSSKSKKLRPEDVQMPRTAKAGNKRLDLVA